MLAMLSINARSLALVLAVMAAGCRNDAPSGKVEKPAAPSMQALIDAYAAPTAALDAAGIVQLAAAVGQRIATADSLVIDQRIIDAGRTALAQLNQQTGAAGPVLPQTGGLTLEQAPPPSAGAIPQDDVAVTAQALTVKGEGYLVVTRICDGWGAVPVPDLANGTMQLTVGFTEQGVDPVLWGTLALCKYRYGEHTVQLDGRSPDRNAGDVRVYVGSNVTVDTFGAFVEPLVVELVAQVILDGAEVAGQLSFQIDVNTRAIALLVPIGAGNVIVSLDTTRQSAQVRATNGTFSCDLAAQRCTAPNGAQIGAP